MKNKPRIKRPRMEAPTAPQKSSLFSRGYSDVRRRVEKGSKFTNSCFNCDFYYKAEGDREELCQNPEVLKYDMIVTETGIYCNRWRLTRREQSAKSLFKKKGATKR